MAARILIKTTTAFLRPKPTSISFFSIKTISAFSNQVSLTNLLQNSGFSPSQLHHFLSKNQHFLSNSNLQNIETSFFILQSFKILPKDLVFMVLDCPGILDLEFLKKWELGLSRIGLHRVSSSMIRSMLEVSRRFELDSVVFSRIVSFFKRLGFSDASVIRVLEEYPEVVLINEQGILGIIELLMGIGIRREEVNWIICLFPRVLGYGVDERLKGLICEFMELGFDRDVIAREIVREPRILNIELGELSRCLELLRSLKCRSSIKEKIFRDGAFRAAFEVKQRVDCLCKHGLIRREAFKLLWKEPRLVIYEIENIEKKLDFLFDKMKFGVECLIDVPEYLGVNFEKQIVPRYNVIEYLGSRGWLRLSSQVGLREIIKSSRLKFYNLFVKPYPECEKIFGKFAGDNEIKSRHPVGLWKVFKPQRYPESKEDTKNMKSFMESVV